MWRFNRAIEEKACNIAMKGGASGFLAGRAVWASVVDAQDPET